MLILNKIENFETHSHSNTERVNNTTKCGIDCAQRQNDWQKTHRSEDVFLGGHPEAASASVVVVLVVVIKAISSIITTTITTKIKSLTRTQQTLPATLHIKDRDDDLLEARQLMCSDFQGKVGCAHVRVKERDLYGVSVWVYEQISASLFYHSRKITTKLKTFWRTKQKYLSTNWILMIQMTSEWNSIKKEEKKGKRNGNIIKQQTNKKQEEEEQQ